MLNVLDGSGYKTSDSERVGRLTLDSLRVERQNESI